MDNFSKQIIFEDNHLLVINKRNSQIVHGDITGDESLVDFIKDYLRVKYNKPGEIYCGVAHRLDRPVSGVIVFTKTEKALIRLNKQIHDKLVTKKYWAIVKGTPPKEEDYLVDYLIKDEKQNKSFVTKDTVKGSKAELKYKLLSKNETYSLLEVELITGRHHQIRVQLSNIGCIIKGDLKYGYKATSKTKSISLHAREITIEHPTLKEKMRFVAPVPQNDFWGWFEKNAE